MCLICAQIRRRSNKIQAKKGEQFGGETAQGPEAFDSPERILQAINISRINAKF